MSGSRGSELHPGSLTATGLTVLRQVGVVHCNRGRDVPRTIILNSSSLKSSKMTKLPLCSAEHPVVSKGISTRLRIDGQAVRPSPYLDSRQQPPIPRVEGIDFAIVATR